MEMFNTQKIKNLQLSTIKHYYNKNIIKQYLRQFNIHNILSHLFSDK